MVCSFLTSCCFYSFVIEPITFDQTKIETLPNTEFQTKTDIHHETPTQTKIDSYTEIETRPTI